MSNDVLAPYELVKRNPDDKRSKLLTLTEQAVSIKKKLRALGETLAKDSGRLNVFVKETVHGKSESLRRDGI